MQALASVGVDEFDKASRERKPPVAIRVSQTPFSETENFLLLADRAWDLVTVQVPFGANVLQSENGAGGQSNTGCVRRSMLSAHQPQVIVVTAPKASDLLLS